MEQKKVLEELEVKTAVLCAPEEREHLLRSIGKDRLRSFAGRTNLIKDFDLKGTRLYFSTHLDRLGRVMFLFALVASAFTFLFISGFLAAFLLQATNFSPVLNPIANPLFRFFTLLGCVLAWIILMVLLLFVLTLRTARSVFTFGWCLLTFGQLVFAGGGVAMFFVWFQRSDSWNLIGLILSGCAWGGNFLAAIMLLAAGSRVVRKGAKEIKTMLNHSNKALALQNEC